MKTKKFIKLDKFVYRVEKIDQDQEIVVLAPVVFSTTGWSVRVESIEQRPLSVINGAEVDEEYLRSRMIVVGF